MVVRMYSVPTAPRMCSVKVTKHRASKIDNAKHKKQGKHKQETEPRKTPNKVDGDRGCKNKQVIVSEEGTNQTSMLLKEKSTFTVRA